MTVLTLLSLLACDPELPCTGPECHSSHSGDDVELVPPEDTDTEPTDPDADADGSPVSVDCDDGDPAVHPGAQEVCNGIDDDCDGDVDGGAVDARLWFADADGDAFGDPTQHTSRCAPERRRDGAPAGWVANGEDCDDTRSDVHPGAVERCNGVDDDCDGRVDADSVDAIEWFRDLDGDGFGDAADVVRACAPAPDRVGQAGDCDDADPERHPDAAERCTAQDMDCDGDAYAGAVDPGRWYRDGDGDGYGVTDGAVDACEAPPGFVAVDGDCGDVEAGVNPDAEERCNGVDDDCDGEVDVGAVDVSLYFSDADGDGHGAGAAVLPACAPRLGLASLGGDCDDDDAAVNPSADERCNAVDDDCDGEADEDPVDGSLYLHDGDGDGYGVAPPTVLACGPGVGVVELGGDCADGDPDVHPGAAEVCNAVDDDCDGDIDTDAVDRIAAWADADGDTFGDGGVMVWACEAPPGFVLNDQDCADSDSSRNPDADERCNSVDDDCDGLVDDDPVDGQLFFLDGDGDRYGAGPRSAPACVLGPGVASEDGDCDDADAAMHPFAPERCNGLDDDCDGLVSDQERDQNSNGQMDCEEGCRERNGLTWGGSYNHQYDYNYVSCHVPVNGRCDPYVGDTSCNQFLPVVCFKPGSAPDPRGLNGTWRWSGGNVIATTGQPIRGCRLTSKAVADAWCVQHVGVGFRMIDHDDAGGWDVAGYALGERVTSGRLMWASVGNQSANCWN